MVIERILNNPDRFSPMSRSVQPRWTLWGDRCWCGSWITSASPRRTPSSWQCLRPSWSSTISRRCWQGCYPRLAFRTFLRRFFVGGKTVTDTRFVVDVFLFLLWETKGNKNGEMECLQVNFLVGYLLLNYDIRKGFTSVTNINHLPPKQLTLEPEMFCFLPWG